MRCFAQTQWEKLPGPNAGIFYSLAVSKDTVYAVGEGGYAFKSIDKGKTWIRLPLIGGFEDLRSSAVDESGVFHIATGDNYYRSTNYGASWIGPSSITRPGGALTAVKGVGVFGATSGHVVGSTDHGNTWVDLGGIGPESVQAIAVDDSGKIYAGTENRIIRSTGSYLNWDTRVFEGGDVKSIVIAPNGFPLAKKSN